MVEVFSLINQEAWQALLARNYSAFCVFFWLEDSKQVAFSSEDLRSFVFSSSLNFKWPLFPLLQRKVLFLRVRNGLG